MNSSCQRKSDFLIYTYHIMHFPLFCIVGWRQILCYFCPVGEKWENERAGSSHWDLWSGISKTCVPETWTLLSNLCRWTFDMAHKLDFLIWVKWGHLKSTVISCNLCWIFSQHIRMTSGLNMLHYSHWAIKQFLDLIGFLFQKIRCVYKSLK